MNVHGDTSPRPKMTRKERKSNCLPNSITKSVITAPRSGSLWGLILGGNGASHNRTSSRVAEAIWSPQVLAGLCALGPNIASKLDRALTGLSWLPGTWRELWPLACFALVWSNECKNLFKRNLGLRSPTQRPLNLWKPEGHSAWWQLRPHVKRLASLAAKLRSGWSNKGIAPPQARCAAAIMRTAWRCLPSSRKIPFVG